MSPQVVKWFRGVRAAFVDGFVEGLPIGSPAGAGVSVADGAARASMTLAHVLFLLAHILGLPVLNGLSDVRAFVKAHHFPSPYDEEDPPTYPAGQGTGAAAVTRPGGPGMG